MSETRQRLGWKAHWRPMRAILAFVVMGLMLACSGPSAVAPTAKPAASTASCNTAYNPAAPSADRACRYEGQTLTIGSLSGAFTDALKVGVEKVFEEQTGGKLNWIASDPQTVISQLIASKGTTPPFDVVLLETTSAVRAVEADVLQKIDYSRVPNIAALPPSAFRVEGYGPGMYYFLMGLCYNTQRFQQAGIGEPDGLNTLFDPRLANHVGLPDTGHANWGISMPAIARAFGQPVSNPDPVVERLKSIQGVKLFASSADLEAEMTNGDVWVSLNSDGRCNGRAAKGEPWKFGSLKMTIDGKPYDYIGITTGPEIAAGTTKVAMAETFVNLVLTPEAITPLAKQFIYTPTFPASAEALAKDPAVSPYILTKFDTLYTANYAEFLPHLNTWVASWNRAFKG